MIKRYAKTALLAMAMLCSFSTMAQDRFVKIVAQGAMPLGGCSGMELGAGVNLGYNSNKLNLKLTVNRASLGTALSEEEDSYYYYPQYPTENQYEQYEKVGMNYRRLSVPVELYWRSYEESLGSVYLLGGAVYNLQLSGECFGDKSLEPVFELTDGLRRQTFAVRLGCGLSTYYSENVNVGFDIYVDINVASPVCKYSISDRLFEYQGSIEDAFGRSSLVVAAYLTF